MIDTSVLWQVAQRQWPQISQDKTYLMFTEMPVVETLVLKEKLLDIDTSWRGAALRVAELMGANTGLSLDERAALFKASDDFEMERIALAPVGDFIMGYSPRANLLAVQEVQE